MALSSGRHQSDPLAPCGRFELIQFMQSSGFQFTLATLMKGVMLASLLFGAAATIGLDWRAWLDPIGAAVTIVLFLIAMAALPVAFVWLLLAARRCPHCNSRLDGPNAQCANCGAAAVR